MIRKKEVNLCESCFKVGKDQIAEYFCFNCNEPICDAGHSRDSQRLEIQISLRDLVSKRIYSYACDTCIEKIPKSETSIQDLRNQIKKEASLFQENIVRLFVLRMLKK